MGKRKSLLCFFGILVLVSSLIFWNGFMRGSDFSWTVQQSKYWNAVMEMVLAFWIYFILLCFPFRMKVSKNIAISAIFLIFSYLHAYFFATIVCVIYAVFIYLTGYILGKLLFPQNKEKHMYQEFHVCFSLGIAGIILIIGFLSALKMGTAEEIRRVFLCIFFLELVFLFKKILLKLPKIVTANYEVEKRKTYIDNVLIALILTMVTLVVCRANLGIDYDSAWYGLRSDLVLAPYTGIFDKVTLMACVYTYSKGIEVLMLPFAGLNSYSFTIGVNVMFCIVTLIAVYNLGSMVVSKKFSKIVVLLVCLTPSIMNMAVTAKSDMATIYLQIVVLIYAIKAIKKKKGEYLSVSIAVLGLSFGFKPSSIVFSTIIVTIILTFIVVLKVKPCVDIWKMCILPFLAVAVLWIRTWIITGYPITSLIVPLFEKFNFYPNYPYTLPSANTMSVKELFSSGAIWERLLRLYRVFFTPDASDLYTLEISWWGNLFSVIWITSMLIIFLRPVKTIQKMKADCTYAFQVIALVICSAASVGCMLILSTPDGNYFMLMQILTYWFIVTEIAHWRVESRTYTYLLSIPLVICNFLLCIAISWSWMVGVTPIKAENYGYYNHKEKYILPYMETNSLDEVEAYLEKEKNDGYLRRMIGFSNKEQAMHLLPAIVEGCVQQSAWASDTLASADALYKFMEYAGVDGLLIEEEYIKENGKYLNIFLELSQEGVLKIEYTSKGFLIVEVMQKQQEKDKQTIQYFEKLLNMQMDS